MHHAYWREALLYITDMGMPIPAPHNLYYFKAFFISKLFPGHFGSTRNNSKCFFFLVRMSPRTEGKGTKKIRYSKGNRGKYHAGWGLEMVTDDR